MSTEPASGLVAPAPGLTSEASAFWEATAKGRFLIGHCPRCATWFWPPNRAYCPEGGHPAELREASGLGTVYSWTLTRRGVGAYAEAGSYVLAYVELAEGPTMLTNLVGVDPEAIEIDLPVRVVLEPTGGVGSPALPRFRPDRTSPNPREGSSA
ncbi:Zn-ribbon domain-containing OB-fold protein [uncultured Jatrophihabitans sp.]|uniref:Zn-ribbon domain-containing OB-fold protein n=1 Tax=uncultured Jatrophihabitans sp. TaxID=1610747 RepID=UPI0035CC4D51